jgi:hypothetical protein
MTGGDISTIGLCCDIAGAVMLWKFGIPEKQISRDGRMLAIYNTVSDEDMAKLKKYDRISHAAIGLLVLGFLCQAVGSEWARLTSSVSNTPEAKVASEAPKTAVSIGTVQKP